MKTLSEIAQNLQVEENSTTALKFYKEQFLANKYVAVKTGYITVAQRKEISSLVTSTEEDFGMTSDAEIKKNKIKVSEILASAITLDEAYNNCI